MTERVLLRIEEVAELTGFSETTIRAEIRSGHLAVHRLGRAIRCSREDIDLWLETLRTADAPRARLLERPAS